MRNYFIKTTRIGFSNWSNADLDLAYQLWGENVVTRYICSTGKFTHEDITNRLNTEIRNYELYHIQYWPIFELSTEELIGCCGVRPYKSETHSYELGFHLREKYWGQGYASEAAKAAIEYSFHILKAKKLYAGHHPQNKASEKLLLKLGFQSIGREFYTPTGLYHPSYELVNR
nr:GNAT family N-acetyltransferase [uncultured Clostridium sp.]